MANYMDNHGDSRRVDEPPVELSATQARQGSWGRPVFYVLVFGLLLAMFAWWAAENYGVAIAPPTDPTTTSSTAKDPIANEKIINNNQPAGQPVEKSPTIQDSTKL
ncbi:MAG: hypothetical protein JWM58_3366 [Rhizobium sp.]|nr:hypothetical protein [Rhizobium sp.]